MVLGQEPNNFSEAALRVSIKGTPLKEKGIARQEESRGSGGIRRFLCCCAPVTRKNDNKQNNAPTKKPNEEARPMNKL